MSKKFETLKAGLGNGLIVSLTEQGQAECEFYPEDFDITKPYKLMSIDFDNDAIYTIKSLDKVKYYYDLDGEFIKPHLFPLSYLTKPIRVEGYNEGKEFVPLIHLFEMFHENWNYTTIHCKSDQSDSIDYLNKRGVKIWFCDFEFAFCDEVHTFSYSEDFRRFISRNKSRSQPNATAYQIDLFEEMDKIHINWRNIPDYINASESKVYEPK